MKIEQYVMAYGCEHDKIRAILPDGFISLRPVFRINAEIRDNEMGYVEFNTAVEKDGIRGWLNIGHWENVFFKKTDEKTIFLTRNLEIAFEKTGQAGGCPAEKDNEGCFFINKEISVRKPEIIRENKEFCDCIFAWNLDNKGAHGASIGKTLPAIPKEIETVYPKEAFTVYNAGIIECLQVLGSYTVCFER